MLGDVTPVATASPSEVQFPFHPMMLTNVPMAMMISIKK